MSELDDEVKFKFEESLSKLTESVSSLTTAVGSVHQRLDKIEERSSAESSLFGHKPYRAHDLDSHTGPRGYRGPESDQDNASPVSAIDFEEVLLDYEQLRKSLESQKVDKSLTFVRERTGIKRDDQKTFNVINKCAGIAECVVKLTQNVEPEQVNAERLNKLFLCAVAQLTYLREESAALFVRSEYGDNTAKFFRHMQRSTVLNKNSVDRLVDAVSLANAKHEVNQSDFNSRDRPSYRGNYRGNYRSNYRGNYRGYNSSFRGQGQGQFNSNPYNSFQSRQVGGRSDQDNTD